MDDGANVTSPGQKRVKPGVPALLLVTCVGAALSVTAFLLVQGWERERAREEFEQDAEDHAVALVREIDLHVLALECLGGLFGASEKVERAEFREFTNPILSAHFDIQALGWIPRVSEAEREAFEHAAQQEGLVNFRITEQDDQGELVSAEQRPEYFPVYYAEPRARNVRMAGFDLSSDSRLLGALQRSRETGDMMTAAPTAPRAGSAPAASNWSVVGSNVGLGSIHMERRNFERANVQRLPCFQRACRNLTTDWGVAWNPCGLDP